MKVLMVSLDSSLFDPSSPSSARMRQYADAAGSLTAAVVGLKGRREEKYGKVRALAMTPFLLIRSLLFPSGFRCDLVTAQDPFRAGFVGFLLARRLRARLEIQLHGDPWSDPAISRRRLALAVGLLRRADGVRVVSERLRNRLVEAGISRERIFKIPIGLDRSEPAPRFSRPPGFETVFSYVGRLEKGKGVDLLVEAFAAAQSKNPKMVLLVAGDGPERAALESRARRLDLRTQIRFFGWLRDPRGVIAASDALVLPSWSEGWGRTPVEALSLCVPVIMTDVGLAGEVVKDGENGLITPPGDGAALARALDRFAGDPEMRGRLRRGAEASACSLPSFGKTVEEVVAAWRAALSRPPAEASSPPPNPPGRRTVLAIFFLALAARLLMFALINARGEDFFYKFSDGNEYLVVARNLLAGHGFSVMTEPPYLPYSYFSPGYPFLLAGVLAVELGIRVVILFQVLVGAATAAMVSVFGWRIVGRRAAMLAGILLAVEPSTIFWNNQLVTETISTIFLLGSFFALARAIRFAGVRSFAAAGFLLGLSTLVRHASQYLIGLYLLIAFVFTPRCWRRRLAGALFCLSCTMLVLSPWIVRNRLEFGIWFYSTAGTSIGIGKTFQYYAVTHYGKGLKEISASRASSASGATDADRGRTIVEDSLAIPSIAFSILRNDPAGIVRIYAKSLIPFFLGDGYAQIRTVVGKKSVSPVVWDHNNPSLLSVVAGRSDILQFMIGKTIWALLICFLLLGLVSRYRRAPEARGALLLAVLMIAYYALGSGVGGYSRFRFPVTPLILMLASSGIVAVAGSFRRQRGFRRLLVVTQTVDLDHPVLGFFHRWIEELAQRFPAVDVVALSSGHRALPANVRVFSPRTSPKFLRNVSFLWLLARRILASDGVFFHMCPEYAIAASPLTLLLGKRTLLWYTHRSVTRRLKIAAALVGKIFTASSESCRISSPKVEVTGHGISIPEAAPLVPSADFRILAVGRLAPIKEIGTAIEAAAILRRRGIPATVTIIGGPVYSADEAYAARLRSRVDALELGPYTRFAGPIRHEETLSAYRSADVLVNASPNGPDKVVYEAAAAGTTIVAAHPAFKPLFGNRAEDLSFPAGDAVALADRLAGLSALGPDERAKIGVELRTAVARDHSLAKLTNLIAGYFSA